MAHALKKMKSELYSKSYSEFLQELQKRVTEKPFDGNNFRIRSDTKLPGLFNLFESFSGAAIYDYHSRVEKEWNPFSQRPYFTKHSALKDKSIFTHLEKAKNAISILFIESAHEATHVLLWEPLFTGKCKNLTRQQFTDASLVFEGFCFWYADIIVTQTMRSRLPDGELAHARSAVSLANFHPFRAFKAIGINDHEKILDIYMQSFAGGITELYENRDKTFVTDLFERFAVSLLMSTL